MSEVGPGVRECDGKGSGETGAGLHRLIGATVVAVLEMWAHCSRRFHTLL